MSKCYTKTYSGYTSKTPDRKQLDAGAVFVNFDPETDTYDSAVAAGKLLCCTSGGSNFSAVPTLRTSQADGMKGKVKGLVEVESWAISLVVNSLEFSKAVIEAAVITATTTVTELFEKIQAKNYICDDAFITNITWVGRIKGSSNPVYIQLFNALNTAGLAFTAADGADTIVPLTFEGHYDADTIDTPPYLIWLPKEEGSISGAVLLATVAQAGATVTVTLDGQIFTTTTLADGTFVLYVPYGTGYTVDAELGTAVGSETLVDVVAFADTAVGGITIVIP